MHPSARSFDKSARTSKIVAPQYVEDLPDQFNLSGSPRTNALLIRRSSRENTLLSIWLSEIGARRALRDMR